MKAQSFVQALAAGGLAVSATLAHALPGLTLLHPQQALSLQEAYANRAATLGLGTTPAITSGSVSGSYSLPGMSFNDGDAFNASYSQTVTLGYCPVCYQHTYPMSTSWDFGTSTEALSGNYNLGFSLGKITLPTTTVYAGEKLGLFNTGVEWTTGSFNNSQNFSYSTASAFSADFPFDGLGTFSMQIAQSPTALALSGSLPAVPGTDLSGNFSATLGAGTPFDDGYAEYNSGYARLGGKGTVKITGGAVTGLGNGEAYLLGSGSTDAWATGADLISLLGQILLPPPTSVVGGALTAIGYIMDLNTNYGLKLMRQDYLNVKATSTPVLVVPEDAPKGVGQVTLDGHFDYHVSALSLYYYVPEMTVVADSTFTNPHTLLSIHPDMALQVAATDWTELDGRARFSVSTTLKVDDACEVHAAQMMDYYLSQNRVPVVTPYDECALPRLLEIAGVMTQGGTPGASPDTAAGLPVEDTPGTLQNTQTGPDLSLPDDAYTFNGTDIVSTVSEPATGSLVALGALAAGARRRRRHCA